MVVHASSGALGGGGGGVDCWYWCRCYMVIGGDDGGW